MCGEDVTGGRAGRMCAEGARGGCAGRVCGEGAVRMLGPPGGGDSRVAELGSSSSVQIER